VSCHVCDGLAGGEDRVVYDDPVWRAFQVAEVPGWIMLAPKEHVEGTWGLTDEQSERFGRALRDVSAAVKEATGADRVYCMYLGESARHFHAGLFPLQPGEEPLVDNSRIAAAAAAGDPGRAQATREAIRAMMPA
jgi:diadenosine tetraphosphate (Ap4A) HIT family hydrolase